MTASTAVTREVRLLLRTRGTGTRDRWQAWSADMMRPERLSPALLASVWREVLDFDTNLSDYIASPVPVPDKTVVVAGSGKETFKTFNVSTAASVLAASTGIPVIKGVSSSVSAISGAADVLDSLGIHAETTQPSNITETIESDGIAFISYAAFCPTYAGRYDGIFPALSPFSFFMPTAVLAVDTSRYLFGVAHRNVHLAASTLGAVRPDLHTGFVVATEIGPNEIMDEWSNVGTAHTAHAHDAHITLSNHHGHDQPTTAWRKAVSHRSHHTANADAVADALSPIGHPARTRLAEHNAALVVRAAHDGQVSSFDALTAVHKARRNGQAQTLLKHLQQRRDSHRSCTAS